MKGVKRTADAAESTAKLLGNNVMGKDAKKTKRNETPEVRVVVCDGADDAKGNTTDGSADEEDELSGCAPVAKSDSSGHSSSGDSESVDAKEGTTCKICPATRACGACSLLQFVLFLIGVIIFLCSLGWAYMNHGSLNTAGSIALVVGLVLGLGSFLLGQWFCPKLPNQARDIN